MVSTISSAPPESARSLANIAPSAIRMPTLAAVDPNPLENESSTVPMFSPANRPNRQGTEDQRQERVQLGDGDENDDQRDPGQCGQDQLPAGCYRFNEFGPGRQMGERRCRLLACWL